MLELSREVMGGLALAVFWIHVLLIAGAAGMELRDLLRLRRRLRPLVSAQPGAVGLLAGVVARGDGPDGALARNVVEQVGRGKGDGAIHFGDAAHRSEIFGGTVELDAGGTVEVFPIAADADVAVWPDLDARARAAALPSAERIAEVEPQARRAKGWRREVAVDLQAGARVWIAGRLVEREGDGGRLRLEPREGGGLLVAGIEPRAWLAGKAWLSLGFILAELAVATGCTIAAVWPPPFDWVSMLGAAAALGFFLGVQPLGVSLAEAVRTPDRAYLRGRWPG